MFLEISKDIIVFYYKFRKFLYSPKISRKMHVSWDFFIFTDFQKYKDIFFYRKISRKVYVSWDLKKSICFLRSQEKCLLHEIYIKFHYSPKLSRKMLISWDLYKISYIQKISRKVLFSWDLYKIPLFSKNLKISACFLRFIEDSIL